eukprot:scaffold50814_cov41-Attheya_sp.AAC.5
MPIAIGTPGSPPVINLFLARREAGCSLRQTSSYRYVVPSKNINFLHSWIFLAAKDWAPRTRAWPALAKKHAESNTRKTGTELHSSSCFQSLLHIIPIFQYAFDDVISTVR